MECNYGIMLKILENVFQSCNLITIYMLNSSLHLKKIYKLHFINYFQLNFTVFPKNDENHIKFKKEYVGQGSQAAFPSILKSLIWKVTQSSDFYKKKKKKQSNFWFKGKFKQTRVTHSTSFPAAETPFLRGPSLRMTPQAAPIQPEGSPQARRATGWLFVTKCSRLNADITVISSPTKPEAKNRGKSWVGKKKKKKKKKDENKLKHQKC